MKKLIILSALIAIGCGAEKKEETAKKSTPPNVESKQVGTLKIAFYNQDTLKKRFDYYREQESKFQDRQASFEREVERMSRDFQEFYQRNAEREAKGELSQVQLQQLQQVLAEKEQKIVQYQQQEGGKLEQETIRALDDIGRKIESYAKMFCEENGLDIMLVRGAGGQLAYINPGMEVTNEFINFLNEKEAEIKDDLSK